MTYTRTIVCLANSWKSSGRCIAGKIVDGADAGAWFRPISDRQTHEISEEERRYANGKSPQVLEVIRIPCLAAEPLQHQPENHRIDAGRHWECVGSFPAARILELVDHPNVLWVNGSNSVGHINNRVPVGSPITESIYLIHPESISLIVGPISEYNQKRGIKAEFIYNGARYRLKVTDPLAAAQFLALPDGGYEVNRAALCISLGEEWSGYYYKLVAAIIQYPGA